MKLTKCVNGHFYDEEKYSSCPHCQGASGMDGWMDSYGAPGRGAGSRQASENEETHGIAMRQRPMNNSNEEGKTIGLFQEMNKAQQSIDENAPTVPYSDNDGKTQGIVFGNWGEKPEEKKEANMNQGTRPVVGWLVCIEGSDYGKSFNLYGGKNFIGRAAEMDICLANDVTVSRFKHATVIYEPKQRVFFAQPGESHELFYVNGSVVLVNTELKDRDVIAIGRSTFVFVPFCDQRYGWEK
ncbi:MAG: FHA domain-containing protein [Lachnospiraceae bacterium]|nr:FHA domain-containing protein [Lachnospiraceae bacterium]